MTSPHRALMMFYAAFPPHVVIMVAHVIIMVVAITSKLHPYPVELNVIVDLV